MEYKEIFVTPEMAKEWLGKNKVNRNINKNRVAQYARDMVNNAWQFNGEAIKFYKDGSLADGQHRLSAIIKANKPIRTLVITNLPLEISIQDRGRNRNITDSFIMEGMDRTLANSTCVAIAKLHFRVQKYKVNVSDGEIKKFLTENAELMSWIYRATESGHSGRKSFSLNIKNAAILLPCFYAINSGEVTKETVKTFLEVLRTGEVGSLDQQAAVVCRNDIISGLMNGSKGNEHRRSTSMIIEKAICDFNNGYQRKVSYINWDKPIYSNHINNLIKED